jgi:LPS sulfotransferase NodH
MFAARWGCGTDLPAYMKALTERRTGSNGVFGMKVLWPQLEVAYGQILGRRWAAEVPFALKAEALERLLGARPVYVHILRRDLDRQAVSLWTAERTGVWSRAKAADSPQAARYSFRGIRDCRRRLALAEAHWDRFFRVNDIEPIEVAYEDISASFESTVAAVLDRLVPGAAVEIPPPLTVRQADARSEEMYERFLGDLGRHHPDRLSERVGRRLRPR